MNLEVAVGQAVEKMAHLEDEVSKVIVGQRELLRGILIGLLADGHILIEGLPGLAKTLMVTTVAKALNCNCKRVQFTPDLLPADLIGTTIYNPKEGTFAVHQGPIFTNILLADEINRAPPKVQAALLEVMQEKQVSISGTTFKVEQPFIVLATQNPIEQEGTYPLPEAQVDRFMLKLKIEYPSIKEEAEILERMAKVGEKPSVSPVMSSSDILELRKTVDLIYADPKISKYILDIVFATRQPSELIQYGASPRASIYLLIASKAEALLQGRDYVAPEDVRRLASSILRHRVKPSFEAEAEGITSEDLVKRFLDKVAEP